MGGGYGNPDVWAGGNAAPERPDWLRGLFGDPVGAGLGDEPMGPPRMEAAPWRPNTEFRPSGSGGLTSGHGGAFEEIMTRVRGPQAGIGGG